LASTIAPVGQNRKEKRGTQAWTKPSFTDDLIESAEEEEESAFMHSGVGGGLVTRRDIRMTPATCKNRFVYFARLLRTIESRLLLLYIFLIWEREREREREIWDFLTDGSGFSKLCSGTIAKTGANSDRSVTLSKCVRTFSMRRDSGFIARTLNRRLHTQCWVAKILQVYNTRSCFLYQLIYVAEADVWTAVCKSLNFQLKLYQADIGNVTKTSFGQSMSCRFTRNHAEK